MTASTQSDIGISRRRARRWLAAGLAATLAWATPAAADEAAADEASGTFSLQLENDRIANTDRHYTNGARLSWVSNRSTGGPAWVRNLLDTIYPLADVRAGRIGFALGHSIYTPQDTDARALVVNDRPYAGWLYGAISLHAETSRHFGALKVDTLDSVELNLGLVGPQAYAKEVQNTVHEAVGVSKSNGWDNQLKNEPALAIFFERKWRPAAIRLSDLELDIIPHAGGAVGNVFTLANTGGMVRFGHGLESDFGPPHIRPTLSGLEAVGTADRFGWYLFAGAEGRAVLRNIFLDGNTFASSHSVDKKPFVGDFQLGAAVIYHGIRVTFTHVFLTREFDGQSGGDRFGTLSVSANF